MNKNIVHITTMHPTFDTRIFRNECVSLAREGYNVTLCVPHDKEETVEGVKIVPIPKWGSFYERVFTAPKQAVEVASRLDADIYHFHDPELLFAMAKFAKETKARVIWDAHENYENTIVAFNSLKNKLVSAVGAKFVGRNELKFAKNVFAGVVTVTDVMAQRYEKHGIPTAAVGNFSDISKIPYPSGLRKDKPIRFVSSGFQFKERAVIEMAQAYQLINSENTELAYCGKFKTEELKSEIKEAAGDAKNVVLSGPHSWDELVLHEIPQSHVGFVLFDTTDPNNRNGLPNRFFECWSNGVPVITTAGTQVARIVEEERGGVVIPDNSPESISKAMQFFVDNPEEIDKMSKAARKAVEEKYSWNAAFQNLLKLYQNTL